MTYLLLAFLIWFLPGLLGSKIGLRKIGCTWREKWDFGLGMAIIFGPCNLLSALSLSFDDDEEDDE